MNRLGLFAHNTLLVILATRILPVVTNPKKFVDDATIAIICDPVTGGLIVATAVVPVSIVTNVVGDIVVVATSVTGAGC